jgi:DNA invertase Pin-like site-specific DNA recombinase
MNYEKIVSPPIVTVKRKAALRSLRVFSRLKAADGRLDRVVVWRLDRWGRSLLDLIEGRP